MVFIFIFLDIKLSDSILEIYLVKNIAFMVDCMVIPISTLKEKLICMQRQDMKNRQIDGVDKTGETFYIKKGIDHI